MQLVSSAQLNLTRISHSALTTPADKKGMMEFTGAVDMRLPCSTIESFRRVVYGNAVSIQLQKYNFNNGKSIARITHARIIEVLLYFGCITFFACRRWENCLGKRKIQILPLPSAEFRR